MKSALRTAGLSLAMGLMMVGCGGAVAETEQESTLETREDAIPDCSAGGTYIIYYSDPSYTTQIGGRGCNCYIYGGWGKTSTYRQVFSEYCG